MRLPERDATSTVSPWVAERVAGAHQDEIASGVPKAASTAPAGTAKALVLRKSSDSWRTGAVPVPSESVRLVAVVMAGILSALFTMYYLYKYLLVNAQCQPPVSNGPS